MTDDLLRRLRRDGLKYQTDTFDEAAARIEALEASLKTIVTRNRERTWTATDDNPESHWVEQDGQYAKIARAALTPEAPHAD